jgi:hypothetical protein
LLKNSDFFATYFHIQKKSQKNRNLFLRKISSAQKSAWAEQRAPEVRGARRFSRRSNF